LYRKVLDAMGSLFKDFKKNLTFLLPIVAGMLIGVLLFSKVIDYFLVSHEMPTRFCFLGLILGTLPLLYQELKKEGFSRKYYLVILLAAVLGTLMFTVNPDAFPQVTDPNLLQCIILGVAVVATAIIPGLDPAVVLSTLGYYEVYVSALADLNLAVLLPMLIGVAAGGIGISLVMSTLFSRFYTATFSVIFGLFLSMIPNMLNESCVLGWNAASVLSLLLVLIGFLVSFYLGDWHKHNQWLRAKLKK
jgi:putative membrane protein